MQVILESLLREGGLDARFLTLADLPDATEPEEVGATYAENAAIKTEAAVAATGQLCIADDAGLEIEALDGAPGLHSKRFGGVELPFPDKIHRVLELMQGVPDERRLARFRCAVAVAAPDVPTEVFEATCEGRIANAPRGTGGFGYDSIFFYPPMNRTFAELTADEKNQVSHRARVLRKVANHLLQSRMTGAR